MCLLALAVVLGSLGITGCTQEIADPQSEELLSDLQSSQAEGRREAYTQMADTAIIIERSSESPFFSSDRYDALLLGMEYGDSLDAIDYTDPTLGGAIPLVRITGREHYRLSDNLTLGDFAASDGARYARISEEIIGALDAIMAASDQPIGITSGYRHQALNSRSHIRGAARSMHMAGMAADIWSPGLKPIELAELALDIVGCKVGIGLGNSFIHLDMRGRLASWATDDAALTEEEFDRFVWFMCTGRDTGDAASAAEKLALMRGSRGDMAAATPRLITAAQFSEAMAAYARVQTRYMNGAVLLDARAATTSTQSEDTEYVLGFITAGSSESRSLGIDALISRAPSGYFVYVLMRDDHMPEIGMMSQDNQMANRQSPTTR